MVITGEKTFAEVLENLSEISNTKLWLVQKNKLIQQTKGRIASFFRANCYVVVKTRKPEGKLRRDVYVWIGSEVDQDEEYRILTQTYELVKSMEGATVYRQCERNESRQFLDIFPYGIRYFSGKSALYKHFSGGNYVKRLFQIKGRRNVHVTEVPTSYESMNSGDSFVLDDEWSIYCWNGKDSNKSERVKAIEIARMVRDDLCFGKAEIIIADEGVDFREERLFFDALGSRGPIKSAEQGGEDDFEDGKRFHLKMTIQQATRKLYRIIDDEGNFTVDPMTYTRLYKDELSSNTCYLMDTGEGGLFVWVGMKCTSNESIINPVMRFINQDTCYETASVTIMKEGLETDSFKHFFDEWPERNHTHTVLKQLEEDMSREEQITQDEDDDEKEMLDHAEGPIKIWQIDGFNKLLWPTTWYGYFFENECYIIEYTSPETEQIVLYIWQGKKSYEEEQLAALEFAQQMDKHLNYQATLIRMMQGKEVEHFLHLFKGQLVILRGEDSNRNDPKFFKINGIEKNNMHVTQLPRDSSLLQSDGAFLLLRNEKMYLWEGKDVTENMKDLAEDVADQLAPDGDFYIFTETQEIPEFWEGLGGKKERKEQNEEITAKNEEQECDQRIRLFHCSDESGKMQVLEIHPFDQKDLNGDDVMILDAYQEVFVWIGDGANDEEKRTGNTTAKDFIKESGRDPIETTINIEKQGLETPNFITHFKDWNYELALEQVSYAQMKKLIKQENDKKKDIDPTKQKKTNQFGERISKRTQYKGILKS